MSCTSRIASDIYSARDDCCAILVLHVRNKIWARRDLNSRHRADFSGKATELSGLRGRRYNQTELRALLHKNAQKSLITFYCNSSTESKASIKPNFPFALSLSLNAAIDTSAITARLRLRTGNITVPGPVSSAFNIR